MQYGSIEWLEDKFNSCEDDPWGHTWRGQELTRYDFLLNIITNSRPGDSYRQSLDIGCTTGFFTNKLHKLSADVSGVDISTIAIARAREKYPDINFMAGSITDLDLPDGLYDLITCTEMLYYLDIETQTQVLQRIHDLLSDDGRAMITSKIGKSPYFSPEELTSLLENHFSVEGVYYFNALFAARIEGRLFSIYQNLYKSILILESKRKTSGKNENSGGQGKTVTILNGIKRVPVLKHLLLLKVYVLRLVVKHLLKLKFPAKIGTHLQHTFNLRPTTTIILVTRKK
jgi:SAM-dependent methyltransferase